MKPARESERQPRGRGSTEAVEVRHAQTEAASPSRTHKPSKQSLLASLALALNAAMAAFSASTAGVRYGSCRAMIALTRRSLSVSRALYVLSSCVLSLAPPAVDLLEAFGVCVCTRRACCFCLLMSHSCCFCLLMSHSRCFR